MTQRHLAAVVVSVVAMLAALAPPLLVRATGEEVTLAIQPVDPLSLFRGNYVDLEYDVGPVDDDARDGTRAVYAVFADERPGQLLRITDDRPDLADTEFCVRGKLQYGTLEFPNLEQFFVTAERGRELERDLGDFLAVLKVTSSCRAVLVDLEPR